MTMAAASSYLGNLVVYPDDLGVLKRAFLRCCENAQFLPDSAPAGDLALRLIDLFNIGVSDEEDLVAALKPLAA